MVSVSTGVVVCAGGEVEPEDLVRDADAAMYRAKERGPGRFELFDDALRARVVGRLKTENELRRALAEDELVVHYQPYFSPGRPDDRRRRGPGSAGSTPSGGCSSPGSSSPSPRRAG